ARAQPAAEEETAAGGAAGRGAQGPAWQGRKRGAPALFIALDAGSADPQDPATLFLYGAPEGVRLCLWAPWRIPGSDGAPDVSPAGTGPEPAWVPGERFMRRAPFDPPPFTFRSDLRRIESPWAANFVPLGGGTLASRASSSPAELGEIPAGALPAPNGTR